VEPKSDLRIKLLGAKKGQRVGNLRTTKVSKNNEKKIQDFLHENHEILAAETDTCVEKKPTDSNDLMTALNKIDDIDFLADVNAFQNIPKESHTSSNTLIPTRTNIIRDCIVALEKYDMSSLKFPIKLNSWYALMGKSPQSNTNAKKNKQYDFTLQNPSKKLKRSPVKMRDRRSSNSDSIIVLNSDNMETDDNANLNFSCDDNETDNDVFLASSDGINTPGKDIPKNSLVFAKFSDLHYYPARVLYKDGYNSLYTVEYIVDAGMAKRSENDLICFSELVPNSDMMLLNSKKTYERVTFIRTEGKKNFVLMTEFGKTVR
jgi:hypothetical protein